MTRAKQMFGRRFQAGIGFHTQTHNCEFSLPLSPSFSCHMCWYVLGVRRDVTRVHEEWFSNFDAVRESVGLQDDAPAASTGQVGW
jgi:hypothetical protein